MQIQPTYYVKHPDGNYSAADLQPSMGVQSKQCAMSDTTIIGEVRALLQQRQQIIGEVTDLGNKVSTLHSTLRDIEMKIRSAGVLFEDTRDGTHWAIAEHMPCGPTLRNSFEQRWQPWARSLMKGLYPDPAQAQKE